MSEPKARRSYDYLVREYDRLTMALAVEGDETAAWRKDAKVWEQIAERREDEIVRLRRMLHAEGYSDNDIGATIYAEAIRQEMTRQIDTCDECVAANAGPCPHVAACQSVVEAMRTIAARVETRRIGIHMDGTSVFTEPLIAEIHGLAVNALAAAGSGADTQ